MSFFGHKRVVVAVSLAIILSGILLTGCAGRRFAPNGWAGPVVSDGTIYVATHDGDLLGVDASDKSVRILTPRAGDEPASFLGCEGGAAPVLIPYANPIIWNGVIYAASYDGMVYAINATNGAELWRYDTKAAIVGTPAIDPVDGNPLIIASGRKLFAFDLENNGRLLWEKPFKSRGDIWCNPVIYNNRAYFGDLAHKLYAVDLNSGEITPGWPRDFDGPVLSTPLIVDGTLYIGTFERKFYALRADTGDPVWAEPFMADDWFWTTPAYGNGTIYVGSLDHNVYALDAQTGHLRWQYMTRGPIRAAACLGEGVLVIASKDGYLYGLDPEKGTEQWPPRPLGKKLVADPVLSDGIIYVVNEKDTLYALNSQTGAELWSKPLAP